MRFLVQAPAIYHPAIAARLRATYPDTRLIPIDASHADPFALGTLASPGAAVRALLRRREPVPPVAVDVLRVKKARRWVWALATTKDYEHSLIESLVSVMHALTTPCVVELLLTPAPTLLERYTGHALARRERRFMADRRFGPNEPGADGVVAKKHLQGAVEGVGRAWWWFDLRVIVPRGHEPHARQVAGVIQETRGENYLRVRVMRLRRRLYAWRSGRGLAPLFPGPVERSPFERRGRIPVAPADPAPEGRSPQPHLGEGDRRDERDQPRPRPRGHARRARAGGDPPRRPPLRMDAARNRRRRQDRRPRPARQSRRGG